MYEDPLPGIAEIAVDGPVQKLSEASLWVFCFSDNQRQETEFIHSKLTCWFGNYATDLVVIDQNWSSLLALPHAVADKVSTLRRLQEALDFALLYPNLFCFIADSVTSLPLGCFGLSFSTLGGYGNNRVNIERSHPSHLLIDQKQLLAANTQVSIGFTTISVYKWWPTLDISKSCKGKSFLTSFLKLSKLSIYQRYILLGFQNLDKMPNRILRKKRSCHELMLIWIESYLEGREWRDSLPLFRMKKSKQ